MTELIAVDPGKMTGVCHAKGAFQLPLMDALEWLDEVLEVAAWDGGPRKIDEVTCESFTITQRTLKLANDHSALDGIGAVRWLTHKYGVKFTSYRPSDVKALVTDAKLRALGLYRPSDGGHMNDATRHWVYRKALLGELRLP